MPKTNVIPHLKRALANQGQAGVISDAEIERCLKSSPKLPRDIAEAFARQGNPVDSVLRRRQAQPGFEWPIAASKK